MPEEIEYDELDIKLLGACEENDGKSLAEILEPFLGSRSERTLYYRFEDLEKKGLIEIDRTTEKGRALCHITSAGKEILAGRKDHPAEAGRS